MKFVAQAALGLSIVCANPAFAAATAPAAPAAASNEEHVKAVQDLLGAIHADDMLRGVAARSHYPTPAQRQAVLAKIDKLPPGEIYQRMAPALVPVISTGTAVEMTRFYNTPYGKKVIHDKYNSGPQILFPGATAAVAPEEKKERRRAEYVKASKELADAQAALEHEAFKLVQAINQEKR
jgi:hypothetical protein